LQNDQGKLILGSRNYELTNHLGNVLAVISDKKILLDSVFQADVISANDYYPFGMTIESRSFSSEEYRFGFQGQESEKELFDGNGSFFKYRISDNRLGRFFSIDPLASKYPWNSPFAFSENKLINGRELEGLEWILTIYSPDLSTKFKKAHLEGNLYAMRGLTYEYLYEQGESVKFNDDWAKGLSEKIKTQFPADMSVMTLVYDETAPRGVSVVTHNHLGGDDNNDGAIRRDVGYLHFEEANDGVDMPMNPFDRYYPVDVRLSKDYKGGLVNLYVNDFYGDDDFVGHERAMAFGAGSAYWMTGTLSGHIKGWGWFVYDVKGIEGLGSSSGGIIGVDAIMGARGRYLGRKDKYSPETMAGTGRVFDYGRALIPRTIWEGLGANGEVIWDGNSEGFGAGLGGQSAMLKATLRIIRYHAEKKYGELPETIKDE